MDPNAKAGKSWWSDALSAALPALVTAGAGYVSNAGQSEAADRRQNDSNIFNAQQAQLGRDQEMQMLQMRLAADAANAGGGNAAAMAAVKQRAWEAAIEAMLSGSRNRHSAAELMVSGMQGPYRGR